MNMKLLDIFSKYTIVDKSEYVSINIINSLRNQIDQLCDDLEVANARYDSTLAINRDIYSKLQKTKKYYNINKFIAMPLILCIGIAIGKILL